jgi:hypothetical protein
MSRKRQLFDQASAKLREAMENASGRDRSYLLEQVVELHRQSLEAADEPFAQANDDEAGDEARAV